MITIPEDAPFDDKQKAWLEDFFKQQIEPLIKGGVAAPMGPAVPVTVLFGSQTGNSEGIAKKLAKKFSKLNFVVTVIDLADYEVEQLAQEDKVLIITSTYGDGEPPDSAADFHEALMADSAPSLEHISYSVLALGDTEYPDFCQCGIEFDERFAELGATAVVPRVDCDVEYEALASQWQNDLLDVWGGSQQILAEEEEEETGYSKTNPFPAKVLNIYNLNSDDAEKETYHIELSLEGSELNYEVGDALGVYPRNDEVMVDELMVAFPFNINTQVELSSGKEVDLREALIEHYDITNLNVNLVKAWQARSGSPYLRSLVEANDDKLIDDFCWGRNLIDLAKEYPADFSDAEDVLDLLKKLQPRLYSISSSPYIHQGQVHLTIAIVRYSTYDRERGGVCSTYFSDRIEGQEPKVYVHENKAFRLAAGLDEPLIMVGPGTGIAPFRAFLEQREFDKATGDNWLFFGNPHEATDYLYQEQLNGYQASGLLTKLSTAFSRDQEHKIYVQDRMREQGAELWSWLEKGAYFYVCGDASRMAKDVDQALHDVITEHGKMSVDEAVAYVKKLKKDKRYSRDVY
mgnify:CR=1 FL=1